MPYSQYYTNSRTHEKLSKNGNEKIVTVIKLIEKAETRKLFSKCDKVNGDNVDDCDDLNDEYYGK